MDGQLGITPIINACGTVTRLGGAPMPAEVLQAFENAATFSASLEQMQAAASREVAKHTGCDAGLITAGSAAALTLGTAAILTGFDLGRMERLPQCDGFASEFVIAREQRSGYDHAVRAAGATLVEVGMNEIVSNAGVRRTELWEYEAAFGPNTAGVIYVHTPDSQPCLADVVALAHRHELPVLVDAAGELPPRRNLRDIPATGADLVAFSGGKAIRGPQSTGILCGTRDLIAAAALQMLDMDDHWDLWNPPADFIDKAKLAGIPRHGIGRGLKVSKEEIAALLTALELFTNGTYDAEIPHHQSKLKHIATVLQESVLECRLIESPDGERLPLLEIAVDANRVGKSAFDLCRDLRNGTLPIYIGHGRLADGIMMVNPLCLSDQQAEILADRLLAAL